MAVSMQKIAERAGVSIASVSRVINNHPSVSPHLTKKVKMIMEELDYALPRRHGKGIRTGYIGLLLINVPKYLLALPTMVDLVTGIESSLLTYGLQLVLTQVPDPERLPSQVNPDRMDGVLVIGHPSAALKAALRPLRVVLLLGGACHVDDGAWADWITVDYEAIGRIAAGYLVGRGHKRITILNPAPLHLGLQETTDAFQKTARNAGVDTLILVDDPQEEDPIFDPRKGRSVVEKLIDRYLRLPAELRPTGLFTTDNNMCNMVYEMLGRKGLTPGRDFEVIARESRDVPYWSNLQPQPATIDVDHKEIARRGVESLLYRINHKDRYPSVARTLVLPSLLNPLA